MLSLAACEGNEVSYTIVEEDIKSEGGKSSVRLYTDEATEENIENIITELRQNDFFGSGSIHAWIHEPPTEGLPEYGALVATAKYAHTENGLAQVGVDETTTVYVEFE